MRRIKTLSDISCKAKKVLARVDFNVPIDSRENILDDSKIVAVLSIIRYLVQEDARLILARHLGRPKSEIVAKYSLRNAAMTLTRYIGQLALFLSDCIREEVLSGISRMIDGSIILLEILRFHLEETVNDEKLSQQLASLADIYVNDIFGSAHRAYINGKDNLVCKTECCRIYYGKRAGVSWNENCRSQASFCSHTRRSKVSDKIKVIDNFWKKRTPD
jgi:phosphoglycerate kinase